MGNGGGKQQTANDNDQKREGKPSRYTWNSELGTAVRPHRDRKAGAGTVMGVPGNIPEIPEFLDRR